MSLAFDPFAQFTHFFCSFKDHIYIIFLYAGSIDLNRGHLVIIIIIITSRNQKLREVLFSVAFVCLFVCFSVNTLTAVILDGF